MVVLWEKRVDKRVFRFVLGSVLDEPVEAIVNPANENLRHGGGVAGLISGAGGPEIQKESNRKAPVPTGSATYTKAGMLPFRYIIHTVGPLYRGGNSSEERLLGSAIRSALEVAGELDLRSVSMPSVSTGIFGYPLKPAINIISQTIFDFMKKDSSLEEIRLCEFDENKAMQIKGYLDEFKTC